jgi:hypothetical protein
MHGKTMAAKKGINWDEQPLGEVYDKELARKLNIDSSSVVNARIRRGIKRKSPSCSLCGRRIIPMKSEIPLCWKCSVSYGDIRRSSKSTEEFNMRKELRNLNVAIRDRKASK